VGPAMSQESAGASRRAVSGEESGVWGSSCETSSTLENGGESRSCSNVASGPTRARLVLRGGCGYSWIMSGRAQKLLGEALDLTDEERAEVALELVASLDGPKDADAEDAWVAEIERRARRVLAEPDGGEDWSAARAEIESKLRRP
jgi:Putative addiction module component